MMKMIFIVKGVLLKTLGLSQDSTLLQGTLGKRCHILHSGFILFLYQYHCDDVLNNINFAAMQTRPTLDNITQGNINYVLLYYIRIGGCSFSYRYVRNKYFHHIFL